MRNLILIFTGCLLLLLGAACAGTAADTKVGDPTALTNATAEQLAVMVLPLDDYGSNYSGFTTDDDSGVYDNAHAIEDTANPNDTAADIEARGRVTGYSLGFTDPEIFDLKQRGAFSVSSTIDQFADHQSASAFLAKEMADNEAYIGQDLGGYTIETVNEFEVPDYGNEAVGFTMAVRFGDQPLYGVTVGFVVGELLASTTVSTNTSGGYEEIAAEWAGTLEKRIARVLSGSLDELPYPLPTPEGIPAAAPTAPPYPQNMVLALDDLPAGATIEVEGYFDEAGHLAYNREFDVKFGDVTTGTSASLESNVTLYADLATVEAEFALKQARISDDAYLTAYADDLAESYGGDAGDVEFTTLPSAVGDASLAYQMVMHSSIVEYTAIYYSVRVGRAVGGLQILWVGQADPEVAETLAARMADRMAAELAVAP